MDIEHFFMCWNPAVSTEI